MEAADTQGACVREEGVRDTGPGGALVLKFARPSPTTPLVLCSLFCCLILLSALLLRLLPVAGCCSELESQSQKPGAMLPPGCSMSDPHYSIRWVQQQRRSHYSDSLEHSNLLLGGPAQHTLQQKSLLVGATCMH